MTEIEPYRLVDEDVEFRLPVELRRELALADARERARRRRFTGRFSTAGRASLEPVAESTETASVSAASRSP